MADGTTPGATQAEHTRGDTKEARNRETVYVVKVTRTSAKKGRYRYAVVYIPLELAESIGLKPGRFFALRVEGKRIVLDPIVDEKEAKRLAVIG